MAGSVCDTRSTRPCSTAAITVDPAPMPMIETSDGFSPPFASRKLTTMLVLDPGALTPTFKPLRSLGDL